MSYSCYGMLLYSKKGIIWLSNFVFLTLNVDENDIINLIGGITRSYYTLAVTSDASLCHSESPVMNKLFLQRWALCSASPILS